MGTKGSLSQVAEIAEFSAARVRRSTAWIVWGAAFIVLGLVCAMYAAVLAKLANDWWNDPNFSHGFFVPLFSTFLLWNQRKQLRAIPVKGSWGGLVIIAAALVLLILGIFGSDLFTARVSFILLLAGLTICFLGWAQFRAVIFPWFFLFFMVPLPAIIFNQITFPLQLLASKLASTCLPILGVPVLRQGNVIGLPAMPLEVAEACSGIRSLISLVTLAVAYGYFVEKSIPRRVVLALAALPIAVAANAIRIVGTGLLVQYWDPDKAMGFFHEFTGWVIFVLSIIFLTLTRGALGLLLNKKNPQTA